MGEDLALEQRRLLGGGLRSVARGSGARGRSRAGRVCVSWSGGSGCSVGPARPTGNCRSSSRRLAGAVTITLRSCTSASRRTSTALRRASKSTRNASCRCPERGSGSRLAAQGRARSPNRVEWVVLALQPPLATCRAAAFVHRLAASGQVASQARRRSGRRPRPPRRELQARIARRTAAPRCSRARSSAPTAARQQRPSARQPRRARADHGACRHRPRNPPRLQASRLILRSTRRVRYAGLEQGNRAASL